VQRCLILLSLSTLPLLVSCDRLEGLFGEEVPPQPESITVAAAGDIACQPGAPTSEETCRMEETAQLVEQADPKAVLVLGDAQYVSGTLAEFNEVYDQSWGRFRSMTKPVPGGHEYMNTGAAGYFAYFGERAGSPDETWYSFEVGGWRLYALDSNCKIVGCEPGSAQYEWLRSELQRYVSSCALAYWHDPRFSSGKHGGTGRVSSLWELLDSHGVDLALTAHDHHYERFAPMDVNGNLDPEGIRQFVVGTGGSRHYPVEGIVPGSEAAHTGTFGILLLTLREEGYDWEFRPVAGGSYSDEGSASCR
jgi:hypothetical protein